MMTPQEKQLVMAFATNKIKKSEFFKSYPVDISGRYDYLLKVLDDSSNIENAEGIEYAILLGYIIGFDKSHVPILCRLMMGSWHQQHENIASILQELRDPRSIDCLYYGAVMDFDYLDYDESFSLAKKCIWALGAINTIKSTEKLQSIAESDNPIKKKDALHQLERRA